MATNQKRRKAQKDYRRGFAAGTEDRALQPNQVRIDGSPYERGFAAGLAVLRRHKERLRRRDEIEAEYGRGELGEGNTGLDRRNGLRGALGL